jgi:ABC-2 type transport system permease protein
LLLSGIVIPLSSFPSALGRIIVGLPSGAMAQALHLVLGQGRGPTTTDWLSLGAWAILAPLIAARSFRFD